MDNLKRLLGISLIFLAGCSDDVDQSEQDTAVDSGSDIHSDAEPSDAVGDSTEADAVETPPCETSMRPLVFAHGFLGSGDNFGLQSMRFVDNGHCADRIYAFDWNTLDQNADHVAALDQFIDDVLEESGAEQVDLSGHSAGGRLSYDYLADASRAAKVAHYVHIASFPSDAPPGPDGEPVDTLNVWSDGDFAVEGADIEGAENLMLTDVDHFGVVAASETFEAMFAHYTDGESPATSTLIAQPNPQLSGRVLTFGENAVVAAASVDVYVLDSSTGFRISESPTEALVSDSDGYWGPVEVDPAGHYEFRIESPDSDVPVHYYLEPQNHTNDLLYMRVLPGATSLAGILLAGIPWDDRQSNVVTFNASNAVLAGRDSLTVDGVEVATEAFASAEQTAIGFFFYDENSNQTSDLTPIAAFAALGQFVGGVDLFVDASSEATVEAVYNERVLRARNWPSEQEGAIVFLFD